MFGRKDVCVIHFFLKYIYSTLSLLTVSHYTHLQGIGSFYFVLEELVQGTLEKDLSQFESRFRSKMAATTYQFGFIDIK